MTQFIEQGMACFWQLAGDLSLAVYRFAYGPEKSSARPALALMFRQSTPGQRHVRLRGGKEQVLAPAWRQLER